MNEHSKRELIKRNKANVKFNTYEEFDDYYKGWDTKHKNFFLISKEDYEIVKKYCWSKVKGARGYTLWHACKKDGNKTNIKLHQLIIEQINNSYGSNEKIIIDHISNELTVDKTDDNRRCNLRLTTQSQNNRNRAKQSNNTSGKIGVRFVKKTNKWVARIYNNEHKRISKTFNTYEEAVEQRVLWEKEFGYIGA